MAQVNEARIRQVAAFLKATPPKGAGLNFYSFHTPKGEIIADKSYPPLNHPRALDFFFLACLHQYGFWYGDDAGYLEPMFGTVGGKRLKGSDLLWEVLRRSLDAHPELWESAALATITPEQLTQLIGDDAGTQWPDFDQRLQLTRAYGKWLVSSGATPQSIVDKANASEAPLGTFQFILRRGSPFWADLFEKKQLLLAMALTNRPEKFLKPAAGETWDPIVDYHLMRVGLRLGLVDLTAAETQENKRRAWVSEADENAIRETSWLAVQGLIRESGLPMAAIDETLWMARKYCPEVEEPVCEKCLFNTVCAKRTGLFQPVFRTTAY